MGRRLINVFVGGRPRTKGSLLAARTPGSGRVKQSDTVLSKEWRVLVSNAVVPLIADHETGPAGDRWRLREGWPFTGAVRVNVTFYFERPKSNKDEWPTARGFGDVDKLLRNVGDALKDAGLYVDDSLVVRMDGTKDFVTDRYPRSEGAEIGVWET